MRVLIAEDDQALGRLLTEGMKAEGYEVQWVPDGECAMSALGAGAPDLLILDLNLPRRDGVEVLEALRAAGERTLVLVLSARGTAETRMRCLDLGADDCMAKPFSLGELRARCRALLRRYRRDAGLVLSGGGVELDRARRVARRRGESIALTNKEYALLECLMLRRGRCVPRDSLLQEVWGAENAANTNVVDVYINYLRRKLDQPGENSLIGTVRGAGYCFGARAPEKTGKHPGN